MSQDGVIRSMNLKQHLSALSPVGREQFAMGCKTTLGHLRNVMYGYRPCSAELASAIERVSNGAVKRPDLRPYDWQEIWPELAPAHYQHAAIATECVAGQGA